jgi:uncharacterized protein YkwD
MIARQRILRGAAAWAVAGLATAAPAVAACDGAGARPTRSTLGRAAGATVCLINQARAQHGLAALRWSGALGHAAAAHSRDMVRRDYFAHDSPGGSTPSRRVGRSGYLGGARAWSVGETIAWGTGGYATPGSIVRGWLRSPGHRAILLDGRLRDVGVGIAIGAPGAQGGATYTGDFGVRG